MEILQTFLQAHDLVAPLPAWVRKLQLSWRTLRLIYTLGEPQARDMSFLAADDRYDELRKGDNVIIVSPYAYYVAQCRELHDRPVRGPTTSTG